MIMQLFLLDLCRIEICTGAKILLLSWNKNPLDIHSSRYEETNPIQIYPTLELAGKCGKKFST